MVVALAVTHGEVVLETSIIECYLDRNMNW